MDLFDELDLPVVLYRPDTEAGWVRTMHARWADLVANMATREQAISDMLEEAAKYEVALDVLRPVMERYDEMSVAEAIAILEARERAS
jgi:hypothetical protein